MIKHPTLLWHKIFPTLLIIGLVWGRSESDTTQIDYSKMGIDAANNDFNSRFIMLDALGMECT